ncbi:MAG TPA: hypothetical protein P5121_26735 [Caldilineaceae bacterium]|nr:hypothetical protein [Caldilineaceae bacterium]HRW08740.1 hypothetical protein [Caldilineaceae bacterium]
MAKVRKASTIALSLCEVIGRLSKQPVVDGLIVVGSTATENIAPQDLFWHYFTARGLLPDGEKAQIAYLNQQDPTLAMVCSVS